VDSFGCSEGSIVISLVFAGVFGFDNLIEEEVCF